MGILEYADVQSALSRLTETGWSEVRDTLASNRWAVMATAVGAYVVWRLVRRPNLPPGPRGIPGLGALHWLNEDMAQRLFAAREKYGEVVCFNIGTCPHVFLNSYDAIMEAFVRRGDDFAGRPEESSAVLPNLGFVTDFIAPYNEKWKAHKKFAMSTVRSFGFGTPKSEAKIHDQLDLLEEVMLASDGAAVDTTAWFHALTSGTIACIIYGAQYSWDDPQKKELFKLTEDFNAQMDGVFLAQLFAPSFPIWFWKIVCRLTLTKTEQAFSDIIKFMVERIEEHRRTLDPQNPRDVLDVYIDRQRSEESSKDSDTVLACNVIIFLPDAIDTLCKLMNWVILYLTAYPEVQKRLHDVLDAVCGSSQRPGLGHRSRLAYIDAVVLEVCRIIDFLPLTPARSAIRDTTFRGYNIPKGTPIMANIHAVHFDPDVHPEPKVFNPDRFLDAEGKLINVGKVMTFSVGHHMCMGESMVRVQLFLFVARLLHRFHLQFPDDQPPPTFDTKIFAFPAPFRVRALLR